MTTVKPHDEARTGRRLTWMGCLAGLFVAVLPLAGFLLYFVLALFS